MPLFSACRSGPGGFTSIARKHSTINATLLQPHNITVKEPRCKRSQHQHWNNRDLDDGALQRAVSDNRPRHSVTAAVRAVCCLSHPTSKQRKPTTTHSCLKLPRTLKTTVLSLPPRSRAPAAVLALALASRGASFTERNRLVSSQLNPLSHHRAPHAVSSFHAQQELRCAASQTSELKRGQTHPHTLDNDLGAIVT